MSKMDLMSNPPVAKTTKRSAEDGPEVDEEENGNETTAQPSVGRGKSRCMNYDDDHNL